VEAGLVKPGDPRCWAAIGVWGDRSCPELAVYAHCWNCPVIGRAAVDLLATTGAGPAAAAAPTRAEAGAGPGILCFRLGTELLALDAARVVEVTPPHRAHSVPHRKEPWLVGLVALQGRLEILVSLARALGSDADEPTPSHLVLFEIEGRRWAFAVSELHGVERAPPEAVERAVAAGFCQAVVRVGERRYGWLDLGRLDALLGGGLR
jgi:chemotaxis signal transduction protein